MTLGMARPMRQRRITNRVRHAPIVLADHGNLQWEGCLPLTQTFCIHLQQEKGFRDTTKLDCLRNVEAVSYGLQAAH